MSFDLFSELFSPLLGGRVPHTKSGLSQGCLVKIDLTKSQTNMTADCANLTLYSVPIPTRIYSTLTEYRAISGLRDARPLTGRLDLSQGEAVLLTGRPGLSQGGLASHREVGPLTGKPGLSQKSGSLTGRWYLSQGGRAICHISGVMCQLSSVRSGCFCFFFYFQTKWWG